MKNKLSLLGIAAFVVVFLALAVGVLAARPSKPATFRLPEQARKVAPEFIIWARLLTKEGQ